MFHRRRDPPERTPNLSSRCRRLTHPHRSIRHYRHHRPRCRPYRRRPCRPTQFHHMETHHPRHPPHRCRRRDRVSRRWCRCRSQRGPMSCPAGRCRSRLHSRLSSRRCRHPRRRCLLYRRRRCHSIRWRSVGSRHRRRQHRHCRRRDRCHWVSRHRRSHRPRGHRRCRWNQRQQGHRCRLGGLSRSRLRRCLASRRRRHPSQP